MRLSIFPCRCAILLAVVISVLSGLNVQAASSISVGIRYLVDPTRNLTLDDILHVAPDRFVPSSRSDISFGYTQNALWLRIDIQSERDRTAILSLTPNFADQIDIYIAPAGNVASASDFRHVATGDHRPLPMDGMSGRDDVMELDLKAGVTKIAYIRIAAIGSVLTTHVQVYPKEQRYFRETISTMLIGIWFGSMLILIVIQLIILYHDRKPDYFLLAVSTLVALLVYSGTLGLSRFLLFPGGGKGNDVFVSVAIWSGLASSTLTAAFILELRDNNIWLYRFFLICVGVGLAGILFGAMGYNLLFAPFGNVVSILVATLCVYQGVRTSNKGGVATRLRAAAYVLLWIGVAPVMVQRTVLADLPIWTANILPVTYVLQAVLLTAILGVRLRSIETQNHIMQQQALESARAAGEQANALVRERTRELAIAQRTAEDALQAELRSQQQQVRFMEVISHQYRTPLAAIRTHIDNIGISLLEADGKNRERLDRVRKGIQRLVEVLEINMSRSRLQGSSFRPVLQKVLVMEIIEAAAARGSDLLHSAIVMDVTPEVRRIQVKADADMLGIAIINLLENAAKFSRSHTREPVLLSSRLDGGQVAISVSDKGIGIRPDDLPRIFDLAWRGANAEREEGSGTGLSLVARIAAAHGGSVHAESVYGKGTTITITVPVAID